MIGAWPWVAQALLPVCSWVLRLGPVKEDSYAWLCYENARGCCSAAILAAGWKRRRLEASATK